MIPVRSLQNFVLFFRRRFSRGLRVGLPRVIRVIPVSSRRSLVLNKVYRGRSKATNVLSFYYGSEYGEIIICPEVIRREARATGRGTRLQTARMVLHGMIHLAGTHHDESRKAERKTMRLEEDAMGAFQRLDLGRARRNRRRERQKRKK